MKKITAEHEDKIYPVWTFIQELSKVQDERFQKLLDEIYPTYSEEITKNKFTELLSDYVFNYDGLESFGEWVMDFKPFWDEKV